MVDLLVEADDRVAVVDHKSVRLASAEAKKDAFAGQLGCYASAIARARPGLPVATWVHLPFEGVIVEVNPVDGDVLALSPSAPG